MCYTAGRNDARGFAWLVLGVVQVCLVSELVDAEEPGSGLRVVKYAFPEVGFEINAPEGFRLRQGLWYHEGLRASLSFAHAKGKDFKSVAEEFTTDSLRAAGHKLLDKAEVEVSGTKGLLVHMAHGEGAISRAGWLVVFPNEEGVCQ